jgi:hypothetical protein
MKKTITHQPHPIYGNVLNLGGTEQSGWSCIVCKKWIFRIHFTNKGTMCDICWQRKKFKQNR